MAGHGRSVWLAGDLSDPWVAGLASALPKLAGRLSARGDLPDDWLDAVPGNGVLVLHRAILNGHDREWLRRFRERSQPPPRVVLCLGPHTRHAELARWLPLVDAVIPEATALDTLARHVEPTASAGPPERGPRPLVCVLSSIFELRQTLVQAAKVSGYAARAVSDPALVPAGCLMLWDVPVLDPAWPRTLQALARRGPLLALLGFADRDQVSLARASGASACLELPIEIDDLRYVLDRFAHDRSVSLSAAARHQVPPPPNVPRRSAGLISKSTHRGP